MGQYYSIVNVDKRESFDPKRDFSTYRKLMETSFIGAEVMLAVGDLLMDRWAGDRVVWSGDYADQEDEPFHDFKDFGGMNPYHYGFPPASPAPRSEHPARYFVNLDKGAFVDLEDVTEDKSGGRVHPLPILLATSNGGGGGDYCNRPGQRFVGTWKGDRIKAYPSGAVFEAERDAHDWERLVPGFTEDVPLLPDGLTFKDWSVPSTPVDEIRRGYDIRYKGDLVNYLAHGSTDTTLIAPYVTNRSHNYYEPAEYTVIDALRSGIERLRLEGTKRWVAQWNEIPTEAVSYLARELGYETLAGADESHYSDDLVAWGDMWTFKNHLDVNWALKKPDAFKSAGISLFDVEKVGLVFGVDGAGYAFLEEHFLPLYLARGLRWHPVDPELERALDGWHPVEA